MREVAFNVCPCDCRNYPHDEPCFECLDEHGDFGMRVDLPTDLEAAGLGVAAWLIELFVAVAVLGFLR